MTTMTIPLTPELSQAIGKAAEEQGTTPETLAAEALRARFGRAESETASPDTRTLADRLAPYVGVLDSGETPPDGARMSGGRGNYGKMLLERHRNGRP